MRRLFVTLTLILASGLRADDLHLARQIMDGAMAELASHSDVWIVLSGVQTNGDARTTFRYDLSVRNSLENDRIVTRMELLDFFDGRLVGRLAGDGSRFWSYDLTKKQYTSADYSATVYPGKERDRLFQNFMVRADGNQTFLARLMLDSFVKVSSGQGSAWMPWRPSATVAVGQTSIVCSSTVPINNTLTYGIALVPGFGYVFTGAEYYEETVVSGKPRTTRWQVQVFPDQVLSGASFSFVPPAGSRAIAVSEARGGGG